MAVRAAITTAITAVAVMAVVAAAAEAPEVLPKKTSPLLLYLHLHLHLRLPFLLFRRRPLAAAARLPRYGSAASAARLVRVALPSERRGADAAHAEIFVDYISTSVYW